MESPKSPEQAGLEALCVNTLRFLAVDAVEKAKSGHPGLPMGAAPMAFVLWTRFLKHDPKDPTWPDRDRFVLSAGHGSMLLYALLHLTGYDVGLDDIVKFRQWGSRAPGHPEREATPGVEVTTGPLGQGFANGVGLAIAEAHLAARYNRPGFPLFDHFTYGIVSDGDLMEGVASEAASLAGHLRLGKLVYLYDDNRLSLSESTRLSFTEDRGARFAAYGWHVEAVEDGNDLAAIDRALEAARGERDRPSLIMVRTHLGYGSPGKQDTTAAHGSPLGSDEVARTKENLGWPREPAFYVPDDARAFFGRAVDAGRGARERWAELMDRYAAEHPAEAAELRAALAGDLPAGWDAELPVFPPDAEGLATRKASGTVMQAIARRVPWLVGGSADLNSSTYTALEGWGDLEAAGAVPDGVEGETGGGASPAGRNLHFGVREHAMGGLLNGLAAHGGLVPYGSTFLIFSDYMRPPMRLAALSRLHVVYVFTHDSIALGEDGPTHQPVEQLPGLRAMPGLVVVRPCDANETREAWRVAMEARDRPVALLLTRQKVPTLDRAGLAPASGLRRGAYVIAEAEGPSGPDLLLLASGSEVSLVLEAARALAARGVEARVVSMPSWELFEAQPADYREAVLPAAVGARLAVEAASPMGWRRFVGGGGDVMGVERFGASAPGEVVYRELGFTVDAVVERALALLEHHGRRR